MSRAKLASNKTEKFIVKEIEKSCGVAPKKYLLILGEVYFVFMAYKMIEAMQEGGSVAAGMIGSILALLWTIWLSQYMRRVYRCIPLSDKLDAEILKLSVEKEKFTQESEDIWKSRYWVRIGKLFFPRNMVLNVEQKSFGKKTYLVILTITGKKYILSKCEMPQASLFPFLTMLQERKFTAEEFFGDKERKKEVLEWFKTYVKEHSVEEMLENKGFLKQGMEKYKK